MSTDTCQSIGGACARHCGFCRQCEQWSAEQLATINAVIQQNPGTNHAYRPVTPEQEHERAYRYARMVALETLRTLARRGGAVVTATGQETSGPTDNDADLAAIELRLAARQSEGYVSQEKRTAGHKGGTGPTAGRKAVVYRVTFPDGSTQDKRVFFSATPDELIATALRNPDRAPSVTVWPESQAPTWEGDFGRLVAKKVSP